MYMNVKVIKEAGYDAALLGLSYNKKKDVQLMPQVAEKLAPKDFGHNKFLESIIVWLEVRAPRYWWQEADTFRLSTKQSESTMHTLIQELTLFSNLEISYRLSSPQGREQVKFINKNFEFEILWAQFQKLISLAHTNNIMELKAQLPEGFLQKRLWCMSYKTLRNIIIQRQTHRLPHWPDFIEQVQNQLQHPELLPFKE